MWNAVLWPGEKKMKRRVAIGAAGVCTIFRHRWFLVCIFSLTCVSHSPNSARRVALRSVEITAIELGGALARREEERSDHGGPASLSLSLGCARNLQHFVITKHLLLI